MDELLKYIILEFQIHNKMLDEKHGLKSNTQKKMRNLKTGSSFLIYGFFSF